MASEWVGVIGTLAGVITTFGFQQITASRATRSQRVERARSEQIEAFTAFAGALLAYRRAQTHRRKASLGSRPAEYIDSASEDVRLVRADAWTAFQRVLLVSNSKKVEDSARAVLTTLKSIKEAPLQEVDELGMRVHWEIQQFVMTARESLPALEGRFGAKSTLPPTTR